MVRRSLSLVLAGLLLVLVVGCSDDDAASDPSEPSNPTSTAADPEDRSDGTGSTEEEDEEITLSGTLGTIDDEGCATLLDPEGVTWQLLVDPSVQGVGFVFGTPERVLVKDGGQTLAAVGDTIEVRGRVSEAGASCTGLTEAFTVTELVDPDPDEAYPTEIEGTFESANGDQCAQLRGDDGTVYELVLSSDAGNVQILNADGQQKLYTSDAQELAGPGARFRVTGEGWVLEPTETCPEATVVFSFTDIEVLG